jgi:hypothetical protein
MHWKKSGAAIFGYKYAALFGHKYAAQFGHKHNAIGIMSCLKGVCEMAAARRRFGG